MPSAKRYSIYDRKTDMPIAVYRSSKECAEALGINIATFYSYLARQRVGRPCVRYDIYEDEMDDEDEFEPKHRELVPPELSDMDYEVILAMAKGNMRISTAARLLGITTASAWYHIDKIEKVTGLSPRNFADLNELIKMAEERSY